MSLSLKFKFEAEHLWYLVYIVAGVAMLALFLNSHHAFGFAPAMASTPSIGNYTNQGEVDKAVTDVRDGLVPWMLEGLAVMHEVVMDFVYIILPFDVPDLIMSVVVTAITVVIIYFAIKRNIGDMAKTIAIAVLIIVVLIILLPAFIPRP